MKLVCYRHGGTIHYGAVKGGRVVDLTTRMGAAYPDIVAFIAGDGLPIARSVVEREEGDFDYETLVLAPVVPNPGIVSAFTRSRPIRVAPTWPRRSPSTSSG